MIRPLLIWVSLCSLILGFVAAGQELPGEEQTASVTLEEVIATIEGNTLVPETHIETLSLLVSTAVESGLVTPEQALGLLDTVGWADLTAEDRLGFAVRALELALAAILAEGATYDEVQAALNEVLETGELAPLMPEERDLMALVGVIKALRETGEVLSAGLLRGIAGALDSGVPPGRVVRLVKSLVHAGADEEAILSALERLEEEARGRGAHGKGAEKKEEHSGKGPADESAAGKKGPGGKGGPGKGKGNPGKGKGKKG